MAQNSLSALLRDHRLRRDLTIEALAERSRVSERTISDIERGISVAPHRATITAIAEGLGLDETDSDSLQRVARAQRRAPSNSDRAIALAPHRLADFTGRGTEIARVLTLLSTDRTAPIPTVVISGAPGFGKTTIALEVLDRVGTEAPKLFVDLDGFSPRPLTPLEVLNALLAQLPESAAPVPPTSLDEAVTRWASAAARSRPIVLLDNAAHESQIEPVLSTTDVGALLVTSRRTLAALPGAAHVNLGSLDPGESVLLLERLIPEFQRTPDDLRALAELADRVPLALRIVGNRIASRPAWTTEDFVARLREEGTRLRQLVAGDLAVESAVALSYDFLEPDTAALFRAISVVDGGPFDARLAAAAVGGERAESERRLDDLTDLGMVEARGGDRYRLHDLLRLYARARLEDEVGTEGVRERETALRAWLLGSLERAGAWFEPNRSTDAPSAVGMSFADAETAGAWVRSESAHWWPALQSVAQSGGNDTVVDVADALHWLSDVWLQWGHWYELFSLAVSAAEALGDKRLEAMHLGYVAWTEMNELADLPAAAATAQRALAAADLADDDEQRAWANFYIASTGRLLSTGEPAATAAKEAVRQFHTVGDQVGEAQAILVLSQIRSGQGEAALTVRELREFLPQVRSGTAGVVRDITEFSIYQALATAHRELGELPEAIRSATDALALARRMGDVARVVAALRTRISVHIAAADSAAAEVDIATALEILGGDSGEAFASSQRALVEDLRAQLHPDRQP